jgi:hypothetical protein
MIAKHSLLAAALALALSGCAPLTAATPQFSPADQVGPPPLAEGVWIFVSEACPERYVRHRGRLPSKCLPSKLSRTSDGGWLFQLQDHVRLSDEEARRSLRAVIVAAHSAQPER